MALHAVTLSERDHAAPLHVRGLRYVPAYESKSTHYPKDRYAEMPLASCLAIMFGGFGCQAREDDDGRVAVVGPSAATAIAYWTREIHAARVLLKPHRKRRDDPLTVFGTCSADTLVGRQAAVQISRHVHERVITAESPKVLWEDAHILAVNKPSGVPTQDDVDGSSSVHAIMRRLRPELPTLRPAHRLDLGCSGVLLLGKGGGATRRLREAFEQRRVHKVYVARVRGRLVQTERAIVVELPQVFDSRAGRARAVRRGGGSEGGTSLDAAEAGGVADRGNGGGGAHSGGDGGGSGGDGGGGGGGGGGDGGGGGGGGGNGGGGGDGDGGGDGSGGEDGCGGTGDGGDTGGGAG